MSTVRKVALSDISLELFESHSAETTIDAVQPLLVLEEKKRFLLVDGFKRFFALQAQAVTHVWVVVKSWSRVESPVSGSTRP